MLELYIQPSLQVYKDKRVEEVKVILWLLTYDSHSMAI